MTRARVAETPPDELRGRWTALRPVVPEDWRFLYDLSNQPSIGVTWRYSGAHVSPEEFQASMWSDVLAQFIITAVDNPDPLGVAAVRSPDFRNHHAHFAGALAPHCMGSGWPLEGMLLFLDYVFATWPFRRLYFESIDYIADRYGSFAERYMQLEGRLEEHMFRGGSYRDLLIYSLTREQFDVLAARLRIGAKNDRSSQ
jgi:RimJ/RimL family protein N-acetyltransferase